MKNTLLKSKFMNKAGDLASRILVGLVLFLMGAVQVTGQATDPSPKQLPYIENFGSVAVTDAYLQSKGMQFSRDEGTSPRYRKSEALLLTVPANNFANRAIQGELTNAELYQSTTLGLGHTLGGLGPLSLLNGNDASLLFAIGGRTFQNVLGLNTSGYENLKFAYSVKMTENLSTATGVATTTIAHLVLQYRTSTAATWNTIAGTDFTTDAVAINSVTTFSGSLPSSLDNMSSIQLRWVTYQDFGTYVEEYLSFALDNISITGTPIAVNTVTAVAMRIKSITPASTSVITEGKSFNIEIETVDANGNLFAVTSSSGFTLGVSQGTGTLAGTITGTILASTTSAIITGISYSKPEVFTLSVTNTSGQPLTSVTSVITVAGNPLSGLTVLYSQNFESVNSLPFASNYSTTLVGMSSYNLDGETLSPSGSPDYGSAGFVVTRTLRGPWRGNGSDNIGTTTYFDNTGSNRVDSNYVGAATSYFVSSLAGANRWLILPAITLSGGNLKLSWQAMSRGSFNFRDSYRVKVSSVAPSNPFNSSDFELITTVPSDAEFANEPSRRVSDRTIQIPSTLENQVVYIGFELYTPAPGGDRIFFDNILVTSGGPSTPVEEEILTQSLNAYPNPAAESVTLSYNAKTSGEATLTFVSATGVISKIESLGVKPGGSSSITTSVADLAPGLYIAKVQTSSGVYVTRFVKK